MTIVQGMAEITIPYRNYFPVHGPHLDGQNLTILKQVVSIFMLGNSARFRGWFRLAALWGLPIDSVF